MYPDLFTIPGTHFTITTFGVMMAVGFLTGYAITRHRMEELGLDADAAPNILFWMMLGGVLGSKLYFVIDVSLREGIPFFELLFSRGGITWYGGLIGGALATIIGCRRNKVPVRIFSNAVAPALAVGQALGRVGCFLVGDDYGKATDVPWAIAFPKGSPPTNEPVHPTQLYEVAWLLPVAAFLWRRRDKSPFLIGEYLALNGLGRIVIEHWRVNPTVALGLTEPQWIGFALVLIGSAGWIYFRLRGAEGATVV